MAPILGCVNVAGDLALGSKALEQRKRVHAFARHFKRDDLKIVVSDLTAR